MARRRAGSKQVALGLALAIDAVARVRNGLQTLLEDQFAAVLALAVGALLDAPQRLVDLAQRVAVALEELQIELLEVAVRGVAGTRLEARIGAQGLLLEL